MCEYYAQMDYKGFIRVCFNDLRGSAKRRNLPVDITADDVIAKYEAQAGRCNLSGEPLTHRRQELGMGRQDRYLTNISVDRIDSNKGYTLDNIQIVASIINAMKYDLPQNDFIAFCHKIANRQPIETSFE